MRAASESYQLIGECGQGSDLGLARGHLEHRPACFGDRAVLLQRASSDRDC